MTVAPPTAGAEHDRRDEPPPSGPPRRTGGVAVRRVVTLVPVVALAAASGLGFHRVFSIDDLVPVVAVAAVAPVLPAMLLSWPRRRRTGADPGDGAATRAWPLWLSIVVTMVGWLVAVCVTLFGDRLGEGAGLLPVLGNALRDSWKGILTTLVPAPGRPELLVLPFTLVWTAAFTSAETALRTSTRAAPALPPVVVFGVSLLLGVNGPGSNLAVAATLVALVVALMLLRSSGRLVWVFAGVPGAAVVGLLAAVVGPYLPVANEPYDPREAVQAPPPEQRDGISPLDRVSAWLQSPEQKMFTVRASKPQNWRLAVLDHFDGVTWSSGGRFVAAGGHIPDAEGHVRRTRVKQRFTLQKLPGAWLPAADRPAAIGGLGMTVDPVSGVLVAAKEPKPGTSYTVTSKVPQYTADQLAGAVPAHDARARAATALPTDPHDPKARGEVEKFRRLAKRITAGRSTPFQRAAVLADWLRKHEKYDVTAPPGHYYKQLLYFLNTSHRGTPEQFGTAFAVMARSIGLPTRVVVGFRPGVGHDGVWQVRSGDVLVWPEVDFAGLGWVPFFPTPQRPGESSKNDSVAAGVSRQKLRQAQKNAASQSKGSGAGQHKRHSSPPPQRTPPPREPTRTPWWVYAAIAAGMVPLGYLAAVGLLPWLRRRRRRRGPPEVRIAGAWRQTLDQLRDLGLSGARTLTAHEVAGFGGHAIGDGARTHLAPLADLVNRAEYAATPPDEAAADTAWRHTAALDRLVTRTAGRARRLLRRLHPRSLRLRD